MQRAIEYLRDVLAVVRDRLPGCNQDQSTHLVKALHVDRGFKTHSVLGSDSPERTRDIINLIYVKKDCYWAEGKKSRHLLSFILLLCGVLRRDSSNFHCMHLLSAKIPHCHIRNKGVHIKMAIVVWWILWRGCCIYWTTILHVVLHENYITEWLRCPFHYGHNVEIKNKPERPQ